MQLESRQMDRLTINRSTNSPHSVQICHVPCAFVLSPPFPPAQRTTTQSMSLIFSHISAKTATTEPHRPLFSYLALRTNFPSKRAIAVDGLNAVAASWSLWSLTLEVSSLATRPTRLGLSLDTRLRRPRRPSCTMHCPAQRLVQASRPQLQ